MRHTDLHVACLHCFICCMSAGPWQAACDPSPCPWLGCRQVVHNDESLAAAKAHPAVVQLVKRLLLLQQPSIMEADVVAQRPDAWTAVARSLMGQVGGTVRCLHCCPAAAALPTAARAASIQKMWCAQRQWHDQRLHRGEQGVDGMACLLLQAWGTSHDSYLRRVFLEAMLGVVQGYHKHVAPPASPRGGQRGATSGGSGRFDAKGFVKDVAAKDRWGCPAVLLLPRSMLPVLV